MDERGFKRGDYGGQQPAYRVNLPQPAVAAAAPPVAATPRPEAPRETAKKSLSSKQKTLIIITTLLIILGAVGVSFYLLQPRSPLPKAITSQGFTIYYPEQLPEGYALKKETARAENGVAFLTFSNEKNNILVSQQPVPARPPDLAHIPGFKKVTTLSGDIAIGTNAGQPTALMIVDDTLLTITGTKGTSKDSVYNLTQTFKPIK